LDEDDVDAALRHVKQFPIFFLFLAIEYLSGCCFFFVVVFVVAASDVQTIIWFN
jgi:hypothetical protein